MQEGQRVCNVNPGPCETEARRVRQNRDGGGGGWSVREFLAPSWQAKLQGFLLPDPI